MKKNFNNVVKCNQQITNVLLQYHLTKYLPEHYFSTSVKGIDPNLIHLFPSVQTPSIRIRMRLGMGH